MKYITRDKTGICVASDDVYYKQKGLIQYIDELCIQELSTYNGRIKSVQKLLNIQTNIPVYVNKDCILIPTKSVRETDVVFINYHRLIGIQKDKYGCSALFDDDTTLDIGSSYTKMQKQISKAEMLLAYYHS